MLEFFKNDQPTQDPIERLEDAREQRDRILYHENFLDNMMMARREEECNCTSIINPRLEVKDSDIVIYGQGNNCGGEDTEEYSEEDEETIILGEWTPDEVKLYYVEENISI